MINRRDFILSGLAAAGAGCASLGGASEIIDTHTHFYDPSRPEGVPWPPSDDQVLFRKVLPEELALIARPLGVTATVVVEASPWVTDNDWVLHLAEKEPFILGLVGHLKPGTQGFAEDLERLASNPLFRGIRTGGWDLPLDSTHSRYLEDLQRLAAKKLTLDVLVGVEQLPKVAVIATVIPTLKIVINHCAGVRIDGKTPNKDWTTQIREIAPRKNVSMKVSGLVEGTGLEFKAPRELDFYRPTLDVLWEAFGENRLLFGSNWPVSARFADYSTVLGLVRDYFLEKGRTPSRKYFRNNALRIYGVRRREII